jgi:hypothetical protein
MPGYVDPAGNQEACVRADVAVTTTSAAIVRSSIMIDVTIRQPDVDHETSWQHGTGHAEGFWAAQAETRKTTMYLAKWWQMAKGDLYAFGIESLGRIGQRGMPAVDALAAIVHQAVKHDKTTPSRRHTLAWLRRTLLEDISVALPARKCVHHAELPRNLRPGTGASGSCGSGLGHARPRRLRCQDGKGNGGDGDRQDQGPQREDASRC